MCTTMILLCPLEKLFNNSSLHLKEGSSSLINGTKHHFSYKNDRKSDTEMDLTLT